MKTGAAGRMCASIMVIVGMSTSAMADELAFLGWEGYADQSFVADFEKESGCKVTATYVGSNDDFAPKLAAGGGVYDLVSVSADSTGVLVAAGLVEPLDVSRIERFDEVYPLFRNAKGINAEGKVWGVPLTWGSIPLMYRTDKITGEPDSYAALWDETAPRHSPALDFAQIARAPLREQPGLLLRLVLARLRSAGLMNVGASCTHRELTAATSGLIFGSGMGELCSSAERATFGNWHPDTQDMGRLFETGRSVCREIDGTAR